jgi:hypothetical protein
VATKFLMGAAVVVALLILGLGAAGWAARDEAREKHETATRATDQKRFCRDLRTVVLPLTGGLGTEVPFDIPPEMQRQDLTEEARFLVFQFDTGVIPGAPPVLVEPLRTISEAAYAAAEDLSTTPFTTTDAERAIEEVVTWYADSC